jgi:hypothetical protein
MATVWKKVKGVIGWNHLVKPDEFRGKVFWVADLAPDAADYEVIKKAGSQLKLDRKTGEYIRIRRDTSKRIKGEVVEFTPPKLFNKDGTPYEGLFIGRGSTVEVTVSIYDSGSEAYGKGTRLEEIRVLEEVEWEKDDDQSVVDEQPEADPEPEVEEKKPAKGKTKLPF